MPEKEDFSEGFQGSEATEEKVQDLFTEAESKDFVCVVEVCKGFCCEHISGEVAENLQKLCLPMEQNGDGEFRCFLHDKETGCCNEYERRTWYCKAFFCPSASRGFMAKVKKEGCS